MNLDLLCEKIGLPAEAAAPVMKYCESQAFLSVKHLAEDLTVLERSRDAYTRLAKVLGDDHAAMLACNLHAAVHVFDRYEKMEIPEKIYVDTMACFSRFLKETYENTGKWQFDRAFWTYRQLRMTLFRIGELEYEILPDEKAISIHIPSDSRFAPEIIDASLLEAKAFFARYFPQCAAYPYVCESWLLSQPLGKLLKPESNILRFQQRFAIREEYPDDREFYQWVFGVPADTPPQQLAENTSMQRSIKQLLLSGGKIGAAMGVIQ